MDNRIIAALATVATAVVGVVVAVPMSQAQTNRSTALTAQRAASAALSSSLAWVARDPKRFQVSAGDAFTDNGVVRAGDLQYVSYRRSYRGLPVYGGDFVVVADTTGATRSTAVAQTQPITMADTTPTLSADAAARIARRDFARVASAGEPNLTVVAAGTGRLAYEVVVTGGRIDADGQTHPARMHVFVDAHTGAVLPQSWDEVRDAAGKGFYYGDVELPIEGPQLVDTAHPGVQCGGQDGRAFAAAGGQIGNGAGTDLTTACVDALHGVGKETDMLKAWLSRDGIDGKGSGFPIQVGLDEVNAFWNGQFANFGHTQDNQRQLTVFDVVAHEFGHAIFQNTPGGVPGGAEAGGMNESTGDIFGALTEAFANDPKDKPDYEVGELADLAGSGPIRIMFDPGKLGDPNCAGTPAGEVHKDAGPQNHWFYLLAEGSNPTNGQPTSPTCNNSQVTGIGIQQAGKIFMAGLNRKTSDWSHARARAATVAAAVELFPNGAECAAVKAAWDAVSVRAGSGEPACAGGGQPTAAPSDEPSGEPTAAPSGEPTGDPTDTPSQEPSGEPSDDSSDDSPGGATPLPTELARR